VLARGVTDVPDIAGAKRTQPANEELSYIDNSSERRFEKSRGGRVGGWNVCVWGGR
jgi:hypothetical protein